jgi:Xaa-Pro aminopeptidase
MKLENPNRYKPFAQRRKRLARTLGDGVVILPTAPERTRNADSHYDYR